MSYPRGTEYRDPQVLVKLNFFGEVFYIPGSRTGYRVLEKMTAETIKYLLN